MHVQSGLLFLTIFAVSTDSTIRVLPRSILSECRIVSSTDTISLAQPIIPDTCGCLPGAELAGMNSLHRKDALPLYAFYNSSQP